MMLLAKLLTKCKYWPSLPRWPLIDKYAQLGTQKPLLLQNKSSGLNQFGLKIHSLFYSKEKIENFVDENLNDICINSTYHY
jgi:hypothetical protein